jgi:hypothetical protein
LEDATDGLPDGLVGIEEHLPFLFSPYKADGQCPPKLPARGLAADSSVQTSADDVELRFGHGTLQAE